ncbi:hypothetical protein B5C34_02400 [Pacificimonas flava]|uniref:Surface lipoprotein n=2 Tax=Pacificimonas TaxID=1960290 RepID=A0A219B2R1_9SPHN|nr:MULTISPECIES: VacJ family lipoprotein [Pacificimonas]MBZ6377929.1 VacJ family lipoprotein [Pacificimonas aurantium]OWV32413.1 hypothetical protein B5C34_02400 [Pacificimonas flava]
MTRRYASLLILLPVLSACATTPAGYETAQRDSLEDFNRGVYSFNKAVDDAVLKPVAQGYVAAVPAPARKGIGNALGNVEEPLSFVNAVLQGKFKRAFRAVDRFVINSTYGFLGTIDRAAELGLEEQPEDFGQTLAVWGVGSGPFLVLPILGPSSLRDAAGFGVDTVTNPWTRFESSELNLSFEEQAAERVIDVVDLRAGLLGTADSVLAGALDPYVAQRSAYLQNRMAQITDGEASSAVGAGMEEFEPVDYGAPPVEDVSGDGAEMPGSADMPETADDLDDPAPESTSDEPRPGE